jgi:two-component system, LytTR family, sensor kinase
MSALMNRVSRIFSRYKLHILFWSVYIIFWTITSHYQYGGSTWRSFFFTIIWFIGQAFVSYYCIYWLVPKYFSHKRYLIFTLLMIAASVLSASFITASMIGVYSFSGIHENTSLLREFLYTMFGNIYMVFVIIAIKSLKDKVQNDRRSQLLEKEKTENELRFLKSQMNPHFLFNAINSIYVLIKKDPDFAALTLVKFADMLRYQLYECNTDEIPIEKEISYLDNYIELEKIRKGKLIHTRYEIGSDTCNFSIAPLLIMPFVENAFKYVSSCPDRRNFVTVDMNYQDGIFELSVENTVDEDTIMPKEKSWGGIGLQNVRRRLKLIYSGRHALEISTRDLVYSVLLTIKVR